MTHVLPLALQNGHLFTRIDDHDWLLGTGAPQSFGQVPTLVIADQGFNLNNHYGTLDATSLSAFVGHETAGIIGVDILNRFDVLFDVPQGRLTLATEQLDCAGNRIAMDQVQGIPVIPVTINGTPLRMFLETGAQVSYWQDRSLTSFPPAGPVTDFYPGIGQFQVETHGVVVTIGGAAFTIRCGKVPAVMAPVLRQTRTNGIIGNQLFQNRVVGFFPRKRQVVAG